MVRYIWFALVLIANVGYSQCNEDLLRKVERNGCTVVEMSPEKFAYFLENTLQTKKLEETIPLIRQKLDSVYVNNQKMRELDSTKLNRTINYYELKITEKENKFKKTKRSYQATTGVLLVITLLLCF